MYAIIILTGWTGERVCFAGDSAGGNLAVSAALRAVSYEIRIPDGILAAYTPFMVQYTPSPSRLMSMIDPLLPVGILTRCLAGKKRSGLQIRSIFIFLECLFLHQILCMAMVRIIS